MPRRDGTGPQGMGPKTGRGLGNCGTNKPNTDVKPPRNGQGSVNGKGNGNRPNNK
ncbi:MAG TPA: DUF5320 domain-containing protein [Bacilli bacterium]|nr:DUF5320 domain-containing protein [Bacilli bacterium]